MHHPEKSPSTCFKKNGRLVVAPLLALEYAVSNAVIASPGLEYCVIPLGIWEPIITEL